MNLSHHQRRTVSNVIVGLFVLWAWPNAVNALSPPPENAALLYYQACIKRAHISAPFDLEMTLFGRPPSDSVKKFVRGPSCREVIELVTLGTKISECDWGFVPSLGWRPDRSIGTSLHALGRLLAVNARVLAADGEYSSALQTALGLRQFAKHFGDDTYGMWVMSESVDDEAFLVVEHVLVSMSLDIDTLAWLEQGFDNGNGPQWHPRKTLMNWRDVDLSQARSVLYARWKEALLSATEDDVRKEEMSRLTETKAVEHARRSYKLVVDSAIEILESGTPYRVKYARIRKLIDEAHAKAQKDDPIALLIDVLDYLDPYYRLHVNYVAHVNAVKAAISIYHIKAATGQLPKNLSAGLPKDPYSDEDFEFRLTDDGFSLVCRATAIDSGDDEPRQFDFKVRRGDKD